MVRRVIGALVLLIFPIDPVSAQTGGDGGSLGDIIVDALKELLSKLFSPITKFIGDLADSVVRIVVQTPHPDTVFSTPTNAPWVELYSYYWDSIIPLSLLLYGLMIGLVIFLESTSYLFSSYHRTKLKKRAFSGLLGILTWWWIAALSLQLVHSLTGFLVPDLSNITLFETMSFGAMGVLGLVLALTVDLVLFLLIAIIYFVRHVVLYLFVLMMPIMIVFWIPGVGPFTLVSRFMARLAGFYVPFLFMTVPVALLFRLGELLGASSTLSNLSMGDFGLWLAALVIPIVAVLSPFVLIWQAGALFVMLDRTAHRFSTDRAHRRTARVRERGGTAKHGTGNFARGVRGEPAQRRDGQTVFDSGSSRAHAAGSRLNETGTRLRSVLRERGGGGGSGGPGGGAGGTVVVDGSTASGSSESVSGRRSRNTDFEQLRSRRRTRRNWSAPTRDDGSDTGPYTRGGGSA